MPFERRVIDQRLAAITVGQWEYVNAPKLGAANNCELRTTDHHQHTSKFSGPLYLGVAYEPNDAEFIVHAADDLRAALAEIDRLQSLVESQ